MLTHLNLFFTNAIAPDALAVGTLKISGKWEMSLGRWGIQFFDSIRGGIVNEVIIITECLIFLGIASAILCRLLRFEKFSAIIIVSLLIATAPVFSETFMFIYCADSYCFSFLSAILSAYFIDRRNKNNKYLLLGIIFGVISLSLYQAYIAVTVVLIIIYTVSDILKSNKQIKKVFFNMLIELGIVLVAMICYFIFTKIILAINGIEFASYKGASSLSPITIIKNLPVTLKDSYISTFNFLLGEEILYNNFWNRNILNIILLVIDFILIINLIIKKQIYKKKIDLIFLIFLILIIPIGINIISIIMPDTRTNIVTGPALFLIYIFIISLIQNNISENIINKNIIISNTIIILVLIFTYIMSDNATYLARQEVFENYYSISNDILHKVHNLEGYNSQMKWIFSDNIRYESKFAKMANGTISNDYETWNNIDGIWLNFNFYDRYLGTKLNMGTKDDYFEIIDTDDFRNMPQYPSKDSIKIIDDFVVVKIGSEYYKK